MENLIEVLHEESTKYEGLMELSSRKTSIIMQGDLEGLQAITEEEQEVIGNVNRLEKRRMEVTSDIANVLNKDVNTLKLKDLVQMLASRPAEQALLAAAQERLQQVVFQLQEINLQNKVLIEHSLELVEFDMNLIQSMKTAPQTANYNKGAYTSGNTIGVGNRGFDAKQ